MNDVVSRLGLRCLTKIASALVHAEEYLSDDGHEFDLVAFRQQMDDPEVQAWLETMRGAGLAPRKRKP